MIKINKKYLTIYIFLLILIVALTGCSKNPVTDNYGPSWDMMLELPIAEEDNALNELAGADQFDNMGLKTNENDISNFYIVGTKENPIKKTLSMDLPELSVSSDIGVNISKNIDIHKNDGYLSSITIPFPNLTFGSTGNKLNVSITNKGGNKIDNIVFELWDKNSSASQPFDSVTFNNISSDNTSNKNLFLNNELIKKDDLELKIKLYQSSGKSNINLDIFGLNNITIKKVENLDVSSIDSPDFNDINMELGVFEQINENNDNQSELKIAIIEPSSMNLKFDISNIVLDNKYDSKDGDYFVWDSSPINLGSLSISGDLKLPSDSPINYDATDHANIKVIIIGEASKSSIPSDYQDVFNIENGDLIYTTDSLEVNVSQEDIDTIKDGIIDLDQTYLETIINNETGLELGAEIYISSDKSNLYNTENKINERLLEITSNQNETKRFLLKNTLDEVERTLTEGEVYTGIKFIAGKLDDNTGSDIQFTNNMSLNIKSSVAVKLRINQ